MPRFVYAVVLFAFACTAAAQQPNLKKSDLELIRGSWWIIGLESGGKQQSDKAFKGNTFSFSKVKMVDTASLAERGYPPVEFTFALDPTRTPKTIDLTTRGNTAHGIYKLDSDDLTICMSLGGSRPTEFTTRAGGDTETFTLKRNRWERYSGGKELGFSIDFPGKPTEIQRDFDTPAGKVKATILRVPNEMDRASYTVMVIPLPGLLNAMDAEEMLDAVRGTMLSDIKDLNPKLELEPRAVKAPGGVSAAREFTITTHPPQSKDRSVMRVRLYISGDRLYALVVGGPDEVTKSQNVTWFWNSFRTPADKRKDFPSK
jgi:uncharacterized protein (TIGR03067 family)